MVVRYGVRLLSRVISMNESDIEADESGIDTNDADRFLTWEVGVHPAGHPGEWEHHHPPAETEEGAKGKALKQARKDGMVDPCVYMVEGPFEGGSFTLECSVSADTEHEGGAE